MDSRIYSQGPISLSQVEDILEDWLSSLPQKLDKVLVIPPDGTRAYSLAGPITRILYQKLPQSEVKILPALGTHLPMAREERLRIFGNEIPMDAYLEHRWRSDVEFIGEVPADFVAQASQGLLEFPIAVEINKELLYGNYDLIISVGQVVPHEVSGMANYTKNIVVGCGGKDIIDKSHFLGAVYGMEKLMGRDHSPVRQVYDYIEANFLKSLPHVYVLTVTTNDEDDVSLQGLFIGKERSVFSKAVKKSQECNINLLANPLQKVVAYLEPAGFRSTWLGNKAIYRTRMAIADGGELIILAPGVRMFGEDKDIDALIKSYGYLGKNAVLELVQKEEKLRSNLAVAAHLIHGSSEGRFQITYAVEHLSAEEIRGVNFNYIPYREALKKYNPRKFGHGLHLLDGEKIFFVSDPGLGLWALEKDFQRDR